MKLINTLVILSLIVVAGCGYSARENELTGQVKRVVHQTPILCSERSDLDISLGVMRNGVGSVSTQDVYLTVLNPNDVVLLNKAASEGSLVTIKYDIKRFTWCWENYIVTHVDLLK
jgi:hypothetical protein